jgi:hypothetical protein
MSDTTIGEILVTLGYLTDAQRYAAMEYQHSAEDALTFGEVLVLHGFCAKWQIEEAAQLQMGLRSKKPQERVAATCLVAQRSKAALGEVRRQLVSAGQAIVEKAGGSDLTPIMGVSISGG